MFSSCDVGPYRASASAAQAAARGDASAPGCRRASSRSPGDGAPPHVALVGPRGERIEDTPGAVRDRDRSRSTTRDQHDLLRAQGPGGRDVDGRGRRASPTCRVRRDGLGTRRSPLGDAARASERVFCYRVTPQPGQKVTFAEQGSGAAQPLGARPGAAAGRSASRPPPARAARARSSPWSPPTASRGRSSTVATYVAPAPARPAKVQRLKARWRPSTKLAPSPGRRPRAPVATRCARPSPTDAASSSARPAGASRSRVRGGARARRSPSWACAPTASAAGPPP